MLRRTVMSNLPQFMAERSAPVSVSKTMKPRVHAQWTRILEVKNMNLASILGELAFVFVRGLELSRAERRQQRAPSATEFSELMRGLSERTDTPVVGLTDNRATFKVSAQGRTYPVVVLNEKPLRIGACSAITWRQGTIPQGLLDTLARQNHQMNGLSFDVIEGEGDAFIIIETRIIELTLEEFQAVLNELIPRIMTLDQWLIDNGHVNGGISYIQN